MATADVLARATIATDWGARALAGESRLFDPLHYNNGTVWPFVTGWQSLGLYRYHHPTAGFAALMMVARSAFLWGLGANPEVFSGSLFEPLDTAVPQQFFATSMLITPLIRGLLGWEANVPARHVRLAPHLPPQWDSLSVERLPAGSGRFAVSFVRADTALTVRIRRTAGMGVDTMVFEPALPLGARVGGVTANGAPVGCLSRSTGADEHVACRVVLGESLVLHVRHTPGWDVLLPPPAPGRGDRTTSLKLLRQRLSGDTLALDVEGVGGDDLIGNASLLWCVLYLVATKFIEAHPGFLLAKHEDLSRDPVTGFAQLYNKLALTFSEQAKKTVSKSSTSDNPKEITRQDIYGTRVDSQANLENWKKRLSGAEITRIRRITDEVSSIYYEGGDWAIQ